MRARAARRLTRRPTLETIVADSLRGAAADPASIDPVMIRDSAALARAMGRRETASALAQAARSTFGVVLRGAAYRELLDRVECPVLLVHGGRDRTIPIAFAERVARDHPRWRFARFPALGHLLQLEDPQGWSDVVTRWLASGFAPGG
jgi:pimeloyl-ACP methyl ester carboxylesterase